MTLSNKGILPDSGVDEDDVGVPSFPELDRLSGSDGHDINTRVELILEVRKNGIEQA